MKQPSSKTPDNVLVIRDFPGLASNMDTADLEAGKAQVQTNAVCTNNGELRSRLGLRQVTFEN